MKKILVFYSKTGSGHLRAAEALKEEIEAQKKDVEVVLSDGLEKARFGFTINPSSGYALLSNEFLGIFNSLYSLTNNKLGVKFLRLFIKSVWGKSTKQIIEKEKPDLIITTHHHISPATISKHTSRAPFIAIVTDLGYPHIIWFDKNVSRIITPTEAMAGYAEKIVPGKKGQIVHIDYPLKNHFQPGARKGFTNILLVTGGGSGSGNILGQVKELLKNTSGKKIIVICGNNKKLFSQLNNLQDPRLQIYGFVNNLLSLYTEADIIIGKAGPGTIVEASTLRKPLIITSWVGIQEKDNVEFVTENRLGLYEPNVKKLSGAVEKIYKNYDDYSQGQSMFENGSKKIVEYIFKEFS